MKCLKDGDILYDNSQRLLSLCVCSCHKLYHRICKGSIKDFLRCLYGSFTKSRQCMAVLLGTTRVNEGGITDAYNATMFGYGAVTVKPVVPRAPTIVYGLMVINDNDFFK